MFGVDRGKGVTMADVVDPEANIIELQLWRTD